MLISLKQLVTVSHRVNDQQPSSSQRTWFIAWLTILGLSHANLKIGATYLSKLRIMERIYFVYSSILKSHQIGEPMCLINLIRASLVKLIRSVAKPPIECCECREFTLFNEKWMNESQACDGNYPSWSIRCSLYITVNVIMLVSSSTGPNTESCHHQPQ